jgi:hypothetical protein
MGATYLGDWVEYFIWIGSSFDILKSDQYIDVVLCFIIHTAFE